MKTAVVFIAACALVCTVYAAPFDSEEELVRDLISRAVRSQDDMTLAEMQGWLSSAWNKAKDYVKNNKEDIAKAGLSLLSRYNRAETQRESERDAEMQGGAQREDKKAKEQHDFHFYKDAAQQGDSKAREQHSFHFYDKGVRSQDDMTLAELQGWLSSAWNKAKDYVKNNREDIAKLISKYNRAEAQRESERDAEMQGGAQREDKKAKEQHNFHFYKDAAQQGDKKAREQHNFHFYQDAAQQGDKKAREQHNFHFYDKAASQNDADIQLEQLKAAIESLPEEVLAQFFDLE